MASQGTMSSECEAYERFALANFSDNAFPMVKNKLLRYIKFRARCSTFTSFMTNLEKHPLHGIAWLNRMNNDPDVQKLMQFSLNLWPRQSKACTFPLVGVGKISESGIFENEWEKLRKRKQLEEAKYRGKVHVIDGKKAKGFMVRDNTNLSPSQDNLGRTSSAPIELDDRKLTPSPISDSNILLTKSTAQTEHLKPDVKKAVTPKKEANVTKSSSSLFNIKPVLKENGKSKTELSSRSTLTSPISAKPKSTVKPKSALKTQSEVKPAMKMQSEAKSAMKPKSVLKSAMKTHSEAKSAKKPKSVLKPATNPKSVLKPAMKPKSVLKPAMKPKSVVKPAMKKKSIIKSVMETNSDTKPLEPVWTCNSMLKLGGTQQQTTKSNTPSEQNPSELVVLIESQDPDAVKPTSTRQPVKNTKPKTKVSGKKKSATKRTSLEEVSVVHEPIVLTENESCDTNKKKQKRITFAPDIESEGGHTPVLRFVRTISPVERRKKSSDVPSAVNQMHAAFTQLKRPQERPPSYTISHPKVIIKLRLPERSSRSSAHLQKQQEQQKLQQSQQKRKPEVIRFSSDDDDDEDYYENEKRQKLYTESLQTVRVLIPKLE